MMKFFNTKPQVLTTWGLVLAFTISLLPGCSDSSSSSGGPAAVVNSADPRLGGEFSVNNISENAFGQPGPSLTTAGRDRFLVGNSHFNATWVIAPSVTAGRDGLGPLFIARSCSACHSRDGRGQPPASGVQPNQLLIRLSVPGAAVGAEPLPELNYGGQFQNSGILGVDAEGDVTITRLIIPGQFTDGTPFSLESPSYSLTNLNYGALDPQTMLSPRIAQPVFGLGLLETISEVDILANADENDSDGDGISGRANRVIDVQTQQLALGRFGWKASQPNILQQSAAAFNGDIGLTTSLFINENTSPSQAAMITAPSGGSPEINNQILNDTSFYISTLAVPSRRNINNPSVLRGEQLFRTMKCDSCHITDFTTDQNAAIPELSNQTIHPYTDLLLHDMGPGLADGRPDFRANGQEWRTPPLWGIGLTQTVNRHNRFLHDGRARNLTEAILWHGGEGEDSKEQFRGLTASERADVIAFLNDL